MIAWCASVLDISAYFRFSLKRGQTNCGKFQEGANPNPKGGNPILNIGKANCQGGGGKSIPGEGEGAKAPPHPRNKRWQNFDDSER